MSILPMLLALATRSALAQDADTQAPPANPETAELRERVRLLERALDELRGTANAAPTEIPLDLETRIHGYGAVSLNYLEEYPVLGFNIDELILQYTANLDRQMTLNSELSFEGEEHGIDVGLDVFELAIAPDPRLQFAAGQFHLPLSPWAVTASQGSFRYLPTAVPEALEEEIYEEFLPIDQIGAQLRGQIPVGYWQFSYVVAVTNGRAPDPGGVSNQKDFHNPKALMARVALQSPAGVELGVGAYQDTMDVHDESLLDGTEDEDEAIEKKTIIDDAQETILGASLVWRGGAVELHGEGYLTRHAYDGEAYLNTTGFVTLGVPIRRTTPYVQVDFIQVDPNDPIYAIYDQTGPELELLPGVRYDMGLHLALKAQGEIAYELDGQSWGWGAQTQLAAGF